MLAFIHVRMIGQFIFPYVDRSLLVYILYCARLYVFTYAVLCDIRTSLFVLLTLQLFITQLARQGSTKAKMAPILVRLAQQGL